MSWDAADAAASAALPSLGEVAGDVACSVGAGDGGSAVPANLSPGVSGSLLVQLPGTGAPGQVSITVRGLQVCMRSRPAHPVHCSLCTVH
jgi:hypothetical protein